MGVISLALIIIVLALIVYLLEDKLTFYPMRNLELVPEDFGLSYEEISLRPSGSDTIHGWFFKPRDEKTPVLAIFHGNAGNISHRLDWLTPFIKRGFGALLFDYRGYGLSSGSPSEKAFEEDALAVWDFLVHQKGIAPRLIVPFGRSLGGAPATFLAAERPVGSLVLEGAFGRGKDMAGRIFGFLPFHLVMKNRWEVAANLSRVRVPVMILHGREDEVVPFSLGERLAQTKGPPKVLWWPVVGGRHLDLQIILGASYYERIGNFVWQAAGKSNAD